MKLRIIVFLSSLFLISCQQNQRNETEIATMKSKADSITNVSQQVLLQNVAAAISKGGTEYAIDFCNVKAMPITDSMAHQFQTSIQRISDKNRNPNNGLQTKIDHAVFEEFKDNPQLKDSLVSEGNHYVYYKRINLAMSTCLKCHGTTTTDITPNTMKKINEHYPNDKATGYQLNEFRGLWKLLISQK